MSNPKIEMWPIERLIPYEKNAKIHNQAQIESLAKVIKSQGWDVPIVVDKHGSIIKGHGRRLAAMHLGMKQVPVICRSDLTPAQVRAARLSDNRVALTDFDATLIKEELSSLNLEGFDLSDSGFDSKELDMMLKDLDSVNMEVFEGSEPAPEAPQKQEIEPAPAAGKMLELQAALGFKAIPADFERVLIKFQSYAESMTGKTGALAFGEFCKSVVTELEARS